MENNAKQCPFCGNTLDEKSILYKGYYVCTSCAHTINESKQAEIIRRYSSYIRNLEFKRADTLRTKMYDLNFDVNELQLFTFYSAILDLFIKKDSSKIIKFLQDSTATDFGVVIEVVNFLSSITKYIEKLGKYILEYVKMQEKYLAHINNKELEMALIEVRKRYFKSIRNKSAYIEECYRMKKMSLTEIIDLVHEKAPANIAALYAIFDAVSIDDYSPEEISNYLLACDYSLEMYYEKSKRKISENYREYYKKASALRKSLRLKVKEDYKWQKKIKNNWKNIFY